MAAGGDRRLVASYRRAAASAQATLLPAGSAWRLAWGCDGRLPLYGGDGFHPGLLGTYTAALVVYGRLFGVALAGLPHVLAPHGAALAVSARQARVAQWAAAKALGRTPPSAAAAADQAASGSASRASRARNVSDSSSCRLPSAWASSSSAKMRRASGVQALSPARQRPPSQTRSSS